MSIKKYHSGDSIRSSFDRVGKDLSASDIPSRAEAAYSFTVRCWVSHYFTAVV